MRKLIATAAVLVAMGATMALAQPGTGPAAPGGVSAAPALPPTLPPAPVGHRQPRATPGLDAAESNAAKLDAEDAALDRKIRSICRGC